MTELGVALAGLVVAILSLIATVAVGIAAWRIAHVQLVEERRKDRREFVRQVDAVARVREERLLHPDSNIEVRDVERDLQVTAATVGNANFLLDLVDRDCDLIETIPLESRESFVPVVRDMRAINAERWVADPAVREPNMAYWATGAGGLHVELSGEGSLSVGGVKPPDERPSTPPGGDA